MPIIAAATVTETTNNNKQFLMFKLANEYYAVDINAVQLIKALDVVTPVLNEPEHVVGVIDIEGVIIPIVCLHKLFHLQPITLDQFTVMIILKTLKHTFGIIVDDVDEVISINTESLEPMEQMSSLIPHDVLSGIAHVEDKFIFIVDVEKLLHRGELQKMELNNVVKS